MSGEGSAVAVDHDRSEIQNHLIEEGHEDFAEFLEGPKNLTEFDVSDFIELLQDAWAVRLRNDEEEHHFAVSTEGTLITARDKGRDGDFSPPIKAYRGEFEDYLFSGNYLVGIIYPQDSTFEVSADGE